MKRLTRIDEDGSPCLVFEKLGVDIDRLRKLAEADKDGRVVVLPCRVGGAVYEVQTIRKRIQSLEITAVHIGRTGEPFFYWELKNGSGIYNNVRGFGFSQLGKTVFLTHEEAEAALKEAVVCAN